MTQSKLVVSLLISYLFSFYLLTVFVLLLSTLEIVHSKEKNCLSQIQFKLNRFSHEEAINILRADFGGKLTFYSAFFLPLSLSIHFAFSYRLECCFVFSHIFALVLALFFLMKLQTFLYSYHFFHLPPCPSVFINAYLSIYLSIYIYIYILYIYTRCIR